MFIEKIEVPAFRVLRNVVLEFDSAQEPRIFPLGSENGGGKSTLLQLLFALLHCSSDPKRFQYLANMLATDQFAGDDDERVIARLTIRINDERHVLEFVSLSDAFLKKHLGEESVVIGFAAEFASSVDHHKLRIVADDIEYYESALKSDLDAIFRGGYRTVNLVRLLRTSSFNLPLIRTVEELRRHIDEKIRNLREELEIIKATSEIHLHEITRIKASLSSYGYKHITTYYRQSSAGTRGIGCRVSGYSASRVEELLTTAGSRIFLLGPSNQQYLFLDKQARKALLQSHRRDSPAESGEDENVQRPQIQYMYHLDEAESRMPGFFAYDWLSVEPLVDLFKAARDADFQQVVATGKYGNRFSELYDEVSALLLGKKVKPDIDPQTNHVIGINFTVVDSQGQETPISPEDLSQGELKRLMIYAWLKARRATDAFVLIDEIEASFHPDWQYGIIRDLQEWAPRNQYLLATHSHELCTALTPSHVRALERPLRPIQSTPSSEQK